MAREHWALLLVLGAAVVVRVGMALAYWPALTFVDSWGYIEAAYSAFPFDFHPERPSGYPLLLHLLALPGRSLETITVTQHLAGLATGVLVYALLLRHGIGRAIATAAAALVLLDGYALTLEQNVLSEAFFGLALTASMYLVIGNERGAYAVAASGVLLALSATMRPAALLALPVWLAYLVWTRRRALVLAVALVSLAIPLAAYAAYHDAQTGVFGITEQDGWFLYGRVAPVADCEGADIPSETRQLCQPAGQRTRDPDYYLWNPESPARRLLGGGSRARQRHVNSQLRSFAFAIVRANPAAYGEVIADDLVQIVNPGDLGVDITIKPPQPGTPLGGEGRAPDPCRQCDGYATVALDEAIRDRWFPGYDGRVHPPAGAAVTYVELIHTPRWLMGALIVVAAAALLVAALPRRRDDVPHRREVFLLAGTAVAILFGSVAVVNPNVRYLVPLAPLLICGGTLAARDLWTAFGPGATGVARPSPRQETAL